MAQSNSSLREGLIVGIIGYASVALLYAIFDFFAVRGSLFTVDLLAKFIFHDLRDPAVLALPIELDMTAIFWYNGLHILVALVIGIVIVSLVGLSEKKPAQGRFIFMVFIAGFIITIAAVGILTEQIRVLLPWWSIVVANSLAVVLAGSYLIQRHPGLWGTLNPFGK